MPANHPATASRAGRSILINSPQQPLLLGSDIGSREGLRPCAPRHPCRRLTRQGQRHRAVCILRPAFRCARLAPSVQLDPDGEIVAADIERDVEVARWQVQSRRIPETLRLAPARISLRTAPASPLLPSSRLRKCNAHSSSSYVRATAFLPMATSVMQSGLPERSALAVALATTSDVA
jgi:hypothetical protein